MTLQDPAAWDLTLSATISAYNGKIHKATKLTLYRLVFGYIRRKENLGVLEKITRIQCLQDLQFKNEENLEHQYMTYLKEKCHFK